jgi:ketosteroid isomerase-like protein
MMSVNNAATLRTFVELMSAGDADRAFNLLHPDIVIHEAMALPYGGTYHGIAGFGEFHQRLHGVFDLQVNKYEVHDAGDTAILRMDTTLTARSSGRSIDMPVVELHSFTNGLISDIEVFYWDTQAVAEVLGSQ